MTHLTHMPLTLAVDPGLIFTLIIFAAIGISKIAAALKGDAKPGSDTNTDAARAARQARLDAMAKRRREQMQQATGHATPTNMTAQQSSERQKAKTIYERRAEALRRARGSEQTPPANTGWKADDDAVQREAQRRAADKAEQQQLQRAKAQAAAREQAAKQQAEKAQRQAASAEAERRRHLNAISEREEQLAEAAAKLRRQRAKLLGSGASEQDIDHSQDPAGVTHRRVTNTDDAAYALRADGNNRYRAALTGSSLRTAFVLKEILGPPKALQQSDVDRPY